MDSIFDKINTLVNAQLNDFLGRNPKSPLARIKLDAEEADKNPRRTVQSLHQRLEEALKYEDEIAEKIERIRSEAVTLDEEADRMVKSNDEFAARRVLGQLQMKQQQLAIAEAELRDHRLLTQHLMQEMTTLDMALDGQERQKQQKPQPPRQSTSSSGGIRIPVDGVSSDSGQDEKTFGDNVRDKLNETRASLENLLNNSPVPDPPEVNKRFEKFDIVDEVPDPRTPKSQKKENSDKGDMSDRLSRLSKPDDE